MNNNGFLVKNDRFHLTDSTCYFLDGWLVPDTAIIVRLDKQTLPVSVKQLSEELKQEEQGYEARLSIRIPEELPKTGKLLVYGKTKNGAENLCFRISVADLREKQNPIQYFLEDIVFDKDENVCRVHGWAVSGKPVQIVFVDAGKHKIEYNVHAVGRKDVVSLYHEAEVAPMCGFCAEFSPIPQKCIYLLMKQGKNHLVREIKTSPLGVLETKIASKVGKASDYLKYNGFSPFVKKTVHKLREGNKKPVVYSKWIKKHLPDGPELARERKENFSYAPMISIVVPLYKTPEEYLREMVESVKAQTYPNWELVLSDGSGEQSPLDGILDELESSDERIRVVRNHMQLHISENTNAAIREAKGEFVAFADHDDLLTPNALYEVVHVINQHADAQVIYSDEDKISVGKKYMQPHFKPDFNLDLLCSVNYICHLFVVRRELIDQVGMLREAFDGAQDYDFIFRCVEATDAIYHIPKVLYHWRFFEGSTAENPESKMYAFDAGLRAVQAHYDRVGIQAKVTKGAFLGLYRTKYIRAENPLVSIIIPNKDHTGDLDVCIQSLLNKSTYENFEVIVVENNSDQEETFAYYEAIQQNPKVHVVTWDGPFNYSAINNFGVTFAKGEYLLLLNNDTEIINEDCLEELLGCCMRDDVGIVGARLYFEDDTIQHAGVVVGFGGIAGHAFVQQRRDATGYCHRIICTQDYSAVTAACMMTKRSVFEAVGGLTEEFAVAFNDIDYCLKVRKLGKLVIYNPYAELYHYESKSRGQEDTPEKQARFKSEIDRFRVRWPGILRDGDPYYNCNLSLETQDFSIKRI